MSLDNPNVYRYRLDFGKIPDLIEPAPLLSIQTDSFEWFLQQDVAAENRKNHGLEAVFRSIFPIDDSSGNHQLEYLSYSLGEPKFTFQECKSRGISYSIPLRVKIADDLLRKG